MKHSITLNAVVGEERQITIQLPEDMPLGPVEVTVTPQAMSDTEIPELTRETARQKLAEAGFLSALSYAPPDTTALTSEEREHIGGLFASTEPLSTIIDADRGAR